MIDIKNLQVANCINFVWNRCYNLCLCMLRRLLLLRLLLLLFSFVTGCLHAPLVAAVVLGYSLVLWKNVFNLWQTRRKFKLQVATSAMPLAMGYTVKDKLCCCGCVVILNPVVASYQFGIFDERITTLMEVMRGATRLNENEINNKIIKRKNLLGKVNFGRNRK